MKKNGFTLVELLAVIVILGIIIAIGSTSVLKNINDSKDKVKYIAAKDIVDIAEAYIATYGTEENSNCVSTENMILNGFLEEDVTNPLTGKNRNSENELEGQMVCIDENTKKQDDYKPTDENTYNFDGYYYQLR